MQRPTTPRLSPEFTLAVDCCRWPRTPESDENVRLGAEQVEWATFERLVRRHHVAALAWRSLRQAEAEVPAPVRLSLQALARAVAAGELHRLQECIRIKALMENGAVPLLFLKGAALGALAYGNVALKQSKDVDILVPRGLVGESARLLADAGYEPILPLRHDRVESWHEHSKESVWRHATSGLLVELHTALADNPLLLAGLRPFDAVQKVATPAGDLPTLRGDELFAYLCVHGASSAWFRLKWIADFAALFGGCSEPEVERLYDRAQKLGAERSADQALLLANALFGMPLAPSLYERLQASRNSLRLYRAAMDMLIGRDALTEPTARRLGTVPIHWTQFLLSRSWRYRVKELERQVRVSLLRLD